MSKTLLDNTEIQKLTNSLGLEDVVELQEITSGSINPVFLINNKFILRIDLRLSGNNDKFVKEFFLFETLPKFSIPVPKVIAFDDSCNVIKYPYIMMHKIPGDNLSDVYSSQSNETKSQLSSNLGVLVKKINQITTDDMQNSHLLGNVEAWVDKLKTNFEIYWSYLKSKNFFPENLCNRIDKVRDDYCQIKDWSGVGRLIHGDINPGNIKVEENHIVGIFDFEYASIADPLADLSRNFPRTHRGASPAGAGRRS